MLLLVLDTNPPVTVKVNTLTLCVCVCVSVCHSGRSCSLDDINESYKMKKLRI